MRTRVATIKEKVPLSTHLLPHPGREREKGLSRVVLDHDFDLDTTQYFTDIEDKSLDIAEWLMKYTGFSCPTHEELTKGKNILFRLQG